MAAAETLGITVVNTPEAHVDGVAELALAGLLAMLRKVPLADAAIRAGKFDKPMGRLLRRKTVGFVGFGRVARRLVELLAPFECQLLAHDIVATEDRHIRHVALDELLGASDIVSLHLPYSKAAHHLIGVAQLARMKEDAMLINTARGLDRRGCARRTPRGARPRVGVPRLLRDRAVPRPLLQLANVTLTTHIGSYAREARVRMEIEAVENLLRALTASKAS